MYVHIYAPPQCFYSLKFPFSKYLNIQHACFVVSVFRASFLVWLGQFLATKKGEVFALSIVMLFGGEGGNRVLFSSSLFKCWRYILGLHALHQLYGRWMSCRHRSVSGFNTSLYSFSKKNDQNHAPNKHLGFLSNFDLLHQKILQLENVWTCNSWSLISPHLVFSRKTSSFQQKNRRFNRPRNHHLFELLLWKHVSQLLPSPLAHAPGGCRWIWHRSMEEGHNNTTQRRKGRIVDLKWN